MWLKSRWRAAIFATLVIIGCAALVLTASADPQGSSAVSSWPPDSTNYNRPAVAGDRATGSRALSGAALSGSGATTPGIFVIDPNSVNFNGYSEPSIAVQPTNPSVIDIHGGFGGWNGNADLFHSTDGGLTWTRQTPINPPPDNTSGCPCDTALDWGANFLAGTFLTGTVGDKTGKLFDVYSSVASNPATNSAAFTWNVTAGVTQLTNNNVASSFGKTDQPWLLVNRTTSDATKQNVYAAYDDFSGGPNMRVAVAALASPLNFNVDNQSGTSGGGGINPGHRLATDPGTGDVYSLFQVNNGGGSGSARPSYIINRSTDNGATWPLNGGSGLTVATADSDQPTPKFGTVNCLLGGVDHAAVDPTTGDVYVVYGNRDSGTGNNRLAIRRLQDNGAGSLNIDAENFVTGQVQAALPSVAVTKDGTVGVLYTTFDGLSSSLDPNSPFNPLPIFTAHLATSTDKGVTFSDQTILTFLSPAGDDGTTKCDGSQTNQRVLGDYQQMKAVGQTFYGTFSGNGAALGRTTASIDAIFFKATVGPDISVNAPLAFGDVCNTTPATSANSTIQIFNTGTTDLTVSQVAVTAGSSDISIASGSPALPVVVSPNAEVDFTAVCQPTSFGSRTATVTIKSNDPEQPTVTLNATCNAPAPVMGVAGNTDFGKVCSGSFADLPLTITDSSKCPLTVNSINSTDLAEFFSALSQPFPITIAGGNSLVAPIRFSPTSSSLTQKSATITVNGNDPANPSIGVLMTGTAPPGKITTSGAGSFGNVCAGSNATETITVGNTGPCDLHVTGASINCPDFTIQGNPFPATLSADSSLPLTIAFTPTSGGTKSCTLTITSDDPTNPTVTIPLTATTPAVNVDVPPDVAPFGYNFPATVIQSVGACNSKNPFPVSNNGICPVNINSVVISGPNGADYSLAGLPSLATPLGAGQILGQGNLNTVFNPTMITRAEQGTVTVTYESDPITHATTAVPRALCGEGTSRGARVLVTAGGVPLASVDQIQLHRLNSNRKSISVDNVKNALLQTVSQTAPCASFQFQREWGGVTNPIQLTAGDYQITVSATVNGKKKSQTISFTLGTCSFNQNIVVAF